VTQVGAPGQLGVASPDPTGLPRVGVVSAWINPEQPVAYSGVPYGLISEFRRLGVYAGHRNMTPWIPPAKVIHRWLALTKRLDDGWTLSPEMRVLARASDKVRALRAPHDVDGWVHIVGGHGRGVRGKYVTISDMSPSQLLSSSRDRGAYFAYPNATRYRMEWAAKRQVAIYRHAHRCCVASRWAADSLVRDHGIEADEVHVVGYGCNTNFTRPPQRDWGSPRFLFVGWDWKRKNGDAVVRAFQKLRAQVPDARLDVVGRHPKLDLEGVTGHGPIAVRFPTPVERPTIEVLFASATCFVMPSLIEPFGIVYVEAAAAGMASIATSVGGTADSVGDGGIVVEPHDDDAILRAMLEICDPDTARRLGQAAFERSQLFTWKAVGQRVLASLDLAPIPGVDLVQPL